MRKLQRMISHALGLRDTSLVFLLITDFTLKQLLATKSKKKKNY